MDREVSVTCGGKAVPMNPFVKTIVRNISLALVDSLKKVEEDEELVIRISKKAD